MTRSPASRTKLDAVVWAIGLARREGPRPPDMLDWERVRRLAVRERLAMLCWLRSGEVIRQHAPQDVIAAWRRHALAADVRHETQLALLRDVLATLQACGTEAIVLKGAALAVRAHRSPRARVSTDIDLLVELSHRERARAALAALGWRHRSGAPPLDETLELEVDGRRFFLELHSGLLHDTLRHHDLHPSAVDDVDVEGLRVRTLGGPELPVYLAAHAATHESPALLWLADLDAVWQSTSAPARDAAREVARRTGLHGHLAWALDQSSAFVAASEGSHDAIRKLGFDDDGERRDQPFRRALRLAPSGVTAVRVAGAWIWPRHVRGSASATLALAGARLARLIAPSPAIATTARAELAAPPGQPLRSHTLEVGRQDLLSLVADVVQSGSQVWVKVRGASMAPAIPAGADVRLGLVRERSLRRGDVVLARLPSGLPVLHRVKAVRVHDVVLQGDALPTADPPVEHGAIVAHAHAVRVGAVELRVPERGPRPWRRIGAAWMRRLAPNTAGDSHTRG